MIVISGVLVLVALVLLVIGVVQEALPFVYTSIGVSLVSLLFLLAGIVQRRKEPLPDTGTGSAGSASERPAVEVADDATAVVPSSRRITADAPAPAAPAPVVEEAPVAASVDDEPVAGGVVLVVSGRPRYHVEGCRYLGGKAAEEVDVLDARDEGFTPCGVCRPDEALADDAPLDEIDDEPVEATTSALPVVEDDEAYDDEPYDDEPVAPARPSRRAAASRASSAAAAPAARKTTRPRAADAEAPATRAVTAPAKRAAATKAPAKAPSKAAAAAADGTPAGATARRAGGVVVIPERGRFHRAECRYVRGVDGAESLTKAQATKQGYEACGVCKP